MNDMAETSMQVQINRLGSELERERAKSYRLAQVLAGIHALLYPPVITLANGQTLNFVPKSLDPHALMQELSDRIRAIPDEIEGVDSEEDEGSSEWTRRSPWKLKPGAELSPTLIERVQHLLGPARPMK